MASLPDPRLAEHVPAAVPSAALARNGYALLTDLEDRGYGEVMRAMESFQAAFLALTRPIWSADFPIPGDALAHFSRQWEYPYTWANLGPPGRVLDAGSGITFFPFLLSAAGFTVECCDLDESLGLPERYRTAAAATGCDVVFTACSLTDLPHADASVDAAVCLSVLEHTGPDGVHIVRELARVIRPGGRLVVTCDVDLAREGGMPLEETAALLAEVWESFDAAFPVDLRRPPALLTSRAFLDAGVWRLPPPWRPSQASGSAAVGHPHFRSIAVLGVTAVRKGAGAPSQAVEGFS